MRPCVGIHHNNIATVHQVPHVGNTTGSSKRDVGFDRDRYPPRPHPVEMFNDEINIMVRIHDEVIDERHETVESEIHQRPIADRTQSLGQQRRQGQETTPGACRKHHPGKGWAVLLIGRCGMHVHS